MCIRDSCKTGENIFWGSGLADIKDRLEKDPYMAKVRIKRILPDKIKIEITERTQIGAVVYGDNYVVIDKDENVLRKTEVEPQLTLIKGLTISKIEVGQPIEVEEKVQMRQIMDMIVSMNESDMYFKSIEISEAGVKAVSYTHLHAVLFAGDSPNASVNSLLKIRGDDMENINLNNIKGKRVLIVGMGKSGVEMCIRDRVPSCTIWTTWVR